ncbi:hypothetical protein DL770_010254 [Monosporascus sp. CRB-9-2]|nr:hypothetical protein DL770_010254 [Monosporascus sp. CRB-9-2]
MPRTAKPDSGPFGEISLFPGGHTGIAKSSRITSANAGGLCRRRRVRRPSKDEGACAGCHPEVPKEQEAVFEGTKEEPREREKRGRPRATLPPQVTSRPSQCLDQPQADQALRLFRHLR